LDSSSNESNNLGLLEPTAVWTERQISLDSEPPPPIKLGLPILWGPNRSGVRWLTRRRVRPRNRRCYALPAIRRLLSSLNSAMTRLRSTATLASTKKFDIHQQIHTERAALMQGSIRAKAVEVFARKAALVGRGVK
jgi:hypothetical protein